jgi:hypothetical protein
VLPGGPPARPCHAWSWRTTCREPGAVTTWVTTCGDDRSPRRRLASLSMSTPSAHSDHGVVRRCHARQSRSMDGSTPPCPCGTTGSATRHLLLALGHVTAPRTQRRVPARFAAAPAQPRCGHLDLQRLSRPWALGEVVRLSHRISLGGVVPVGHDGSVARGLTSRGQSSVSDSGSRDLLGAAPGPRSRGRFERTRRLAGTVSRCARAAASDTRAPRTSS